MKTNANFPVKPLVRFSLFSFTFLIMMNIFMVDAGAFIYTNATNNADTYLQQDQAKANFGASGYLGVYGSGTGMTTVMSWTLPNGSGDITKVTLNMYCKNWDSFPKTPVELHVLNENFSESGATWNNKTPSAKWTDPGAWMPMSTNSQVVDKVSIDKDGIYTWVLKGKGAYNSQDSLTWNDTINLALMLPNEAGWGGVQCYSKESTEPNYQPYIAVTNESVLIPAITNITTFKVRKTNALILSNDDVTAHTRINYGTNISNLDKWSVYETATKSPHNILTSLTPDTDYYYRIYAYNYIDTDYFAVSSLFNFRTRENVPTVQIPLVTFVFDDGFKSIYTRALPILNSSHFPGVTAAVSSAVSNGYPGYMNWTELQTLQNIYNWEIASHSVDHADLKSLNDTQLDYELDHSKNTLQSQGLNVYNFISPYGSYNTRTEAHIMKYYGSDRTVLGGPIIQPYNEYPLGAKSIWNTTTPAEAKVWVDEAINNNSWLIFVFHNIVDYWGQDAGMWTEGEWTTDNLTELATYVESKGKLRVVTIREAQTASFDYKGIYSNTATKNLTNTIYPDGSINYSKTVTGHTKVNMAILPFSGYINITVLNWSSSGNYYKRWSEASVNSSVSTYHVIGDFPSNIPVQIKKDGYNWRTFTSNTSGYVTFVYDDGYSEHQFEAISPQPQTPLSTSEEPSSIPGEIPGEAFMVIGVILILFCLLLMIRR